MIEYVLPGLALMALAVTGYAGLLLREHGMVHLCFVLSAWFRGGLPSTGPSAARRWPGEGEDRQGRSFAVRKEGEGLLD
jgi:hypothetical protein